MNVALEAAAELARKGELVNPLPVQGADIRIGRIQAVIASFVTPLSLRAVCMACAYARFGQNGLTGANATRGFSGNFLKLYNQYPSSGVSPSATALS
ncbi:hypothetical protein [Streptomyces sp. NPDC048142]|uniref:hypothetical protein n=1 Tax=Streptomyces sp. NPDC048142 TaxID=3365501 RepID=UPI0037155AED